MSGDFHDLLLLFDGIDVNYSLSDRPSSELPHQVCGPLCSGDGHRGRNTSAEPGRCLTGQLERLGCVAVVDMGEACGLQKDIPRPFRYLALKSSHHTGNGNWPAAIGDEQHILSQGPLYAIQCGYGFSRLCTPNDYNGGTLIGHSCTALPIA